MVKRLLLCVVTQPGLLIAQEYVHTDIPIESTSAQPTNVRITIIGTGYVGLVTGACMAEFGNQVWCADIVKQKIRMLQAGQIPIYEPGIDTVVSRNVENGRLHFTTDIPSAVQNSDIIFIAVGTPMSESGAADLSAVHAVIKTIAENLNSYKVIVTKSTVPIGTGHQLYKLLTETYRVDPSLFDIVSNPEFLREGSAVNDFINPDRIVLGTSSDRARERMHAAYATLLARNVPCVDTNVVSAETIKYACNAFLATKLSFINEIANLCDKTGADVATISYAMGLDHRISSFFLQPGPGFGGSCFPKDTQALLYTAHEFDTKIHTVAAALRANEYQKHKPVEKLRALMNNQLNGKTIAVLGLSFKANTDDIRYSPAITTISLLLEHGASIRAYDPVAMENMKEVFPDITYCSSAQEAVSDADALVVMAEWDEFKELDLAEVARAMNEPIVVDARSILDVTKLKELGFSFDMIGRSYLSHNFKTILCDDDVC